MAEAAVGLLKDGLNPSNLLEFQRRWFLYFFGPNVNTFSLEDGSVAIVGPILAILSLIGVLNRSLPRPDN